MIYLVMFKITQNTVRYFSFREVLLMVALNQVEAKRKVPAAQSRCKQCV
jgi:hypothetical protein